MNDGNGVEIGGARGAVDPLHNYWGGGGGGGGGFTVFISSYCIKHKV